MPSLRKAGIKKRPAAARRKRAPATVAQYLARVPQPGRSMLQQMRAAIGSAVPPQATEVISYRIPAFRHNGIVVWYAAFSDHCSLFPTAAVIETFRKELQGYSTSKGSIHFAIDKPLPVAFIKKLVKTRVAQMESKKQR